MTLMTIILCFMAGVLAHWIISRPLYQHLHRKKMARLKENLTKNFLDAANLDIRPWGGVFHTLKEEGLIDPDDVFEDGEEIIGGVSEPIFNEVEPDHAVAKNEQGVNKAVGASESSKAELSKTESVVSLD